MREVCLIAIAGANELKNASDTLLIGGGTWDRVKRAERGGSIGRISFVNGLELVEFDQRPTGQQGSTCGLPRGCSGFEMLGEVVGKPSCPGKSRVQSEPHGIERGARNTLNSFPSRVLQQQAGLGSCEPECSRGGVCVESPVAPKELHPCWLAWNETLHARGVMPRNGWVLWCRGRWGHIFQGHGALFAAYRGSARTKTLEKRYLSHLHLCSER